MRRLEIGCAVDLCRRVIALQRALEGRATRDTGRDGAGAALGLLQRAHRSVAVVGVVVVKAVAAILGRLLASVDAQGHEADDNQDDRTADTDDDANNYVARRRGHTRRLAAAIRRRQAAGGRRRDLGRDGGR